MITSAIDARDATKGHADDDAACESSLTIVPVSAVQLSLHEPQARSFPLHVGQRC
jgi:hypothetical protein